MSTDNFIPEVWSARILLDFRKNFVFNNLVNRNYEGEITQSGDTVHITTPNPIAIRAYAGTTTYDQITSTQQTMVIDQDDYWGFEVKDLDAVQANVNLMPMYVEEARNSMIDNVDQKLAGLYVDGTAGIVPLDVSANNNGVRDALLEAAQNLDDNSVPSMGRWIVVSPRVYRSLKAAPDYSVASELGDSVKMAGALGQIEGFNIYMTRNVTVATQHKCMYGTNAAITFAEQLVDTEAFRSQASFADRVRGRIVFGRKVVRPSALGHLNVTVV